MKKKILLITLVTLLSGCNKQHLWGYEQDNGPDKWGDIDKEYLTCESGSIQSPINIDTNNIQPSEYKVQQLNYTDTQFEIIDNGHTIKFEDPSGNNTIKYDNTIYTLEQMHFHANSEH